MVQRHTAAAALRRAVEVDQGLLAGIAAPSFEFESVLDDLRPKSLGLPDLTRVAQQCGEEP